MKNKREASIIFGILIVIMLIVLGTFFYNEQKTITGQTIRGLEEQLKEQENTKTERDMLVKEIEKLSEKTCKDVQVPYDAQEEYTEQEPYLKTEEYYESEPDDVEECEDVLLAYNKQAGSCTQYKDNFFADDEPATYSYTINNLDSENRGRFVVEIGFNIGGQIVKEEQGAYIDPSSSHTFNTEKMAEIDNCYFNVKTVPNKEVCKTVIKYKDVLKTREVTDYKTVTKYRTVTKYWTETVCE